MKIDFLERDMSAESLHHAVLGLLALRSVDKAERRQSFQDRVPDLEIDRATEDLLRWSEQGISAVGISDVGYPQQLKQIHNPPPILFFKGASPCGYRMVSTVSIVGSRKAETFSCELARRLARQLVVRNVSVVSGLALGVDGAAHRGAIEEVNSQGSTAAVLGNGLATVYPRVHERLAGEILECGGTLISQFEPDERPFPQNFLNRNRLIAGLSLATVVVEASERSGSLVTARYALEEGREVLIVPGSVKGDRHVGSNGLLRQGATPIRGIEDLLEDLTSLEWQEKQHVQTAARSALSAEASEILNFLQRVGEASLGRLQEECSTVRDFSSGILELELEGYLVHAPGDRVLLSGSRD